MEFVVMNNNLEH